MNRHMTGVMVTALAAASLFAATALFTAPAFADQGPGNVVVMGGAAVKTTCDSRKGIIGAKLVLALD